MIKKRIGLYDEFFLKLSNIASVWKISPELDHYIHVKLRDELRYPNLSFDVANHIRHTFKQKDLIK